MKNANEINITLFRKEVEMPLLKKEVKISCIRREIEVPNRSVYLFAGESILAGGDARLAAGW